MKKFFRPTSFTILFMAGLCLSSCRKEELTSTRPIQEYQIDTLFYKDPGLGEFYLENREYHGEPIITDDYIYCYVFNEEEEFSSYHSLLKIDRANGELLWSWNDYGPGPGRYPLKLELNNGHLLVTTSTKAYIIDAATGSNLYDYTPNNDEFFQGATLMDDKLFISLRNDTAAFLIQQNIDGTGATVLKHLSQTSTYYPSSRGIETMALNTNSFIVWQVLNSYSPPQPTIRIYPGNSIYFIPIDDPESSVQVTTASDQVSFPTSGVLLFKDENAGNKLFMLSSWGTISAYGFDYLSPLRWTSTANAEWLLQNDNTLYAVNDNGVVAFDKETGKRIADNPRSASVKAATNTFLVAATNGIFRSGLVIYDAETLIPVNIFENGAYNSDLYKINEEEFFFSDFTSEGDYYIGKIRITPKAP